MNLLPRRDLRESYCRRYERYIATACEGDVVVDPKAEVGLSAATFRARFADAVLGFRRYKYPSSLIPKDFDISLLVAYEIDDGRVLIKNTSILTSEPKSLTKPSISEQQIIDIMKSVANKTIQGIYELNYTTQEELQYVLSVAQSHPEIDCEVVEHQGKINFYTI